MTINQLQWKIGGEAGFGIMTTGLIFSKICTRAGLNIFAYPEYPSLIRGGHNSYQVHINEQPAHSQIKPVHMLVCLNKETLELHTDELRDDSAVIFDPADFKDEQPTLADKKIVWVPVPMTDIITAHKTQKVARNTIAIGASFGLLDYPWEAIEEVIRSWFGDKKPQTTEENVSLARAGYDSVQAQAANFPYRIEKRDAAPQPVVSGNTAAAMGAVAGGLKFYAAYPMTPTSDILTFLAKVEPEYNLVVKHTEDEIAAMNMIIGAGFAGVRAMTGTSGGGFALMSEALGMAGIAEVPIVAVMGQRPGPSTGLPTWTSQADLRFVLHASQGEFPRIVLAPGDQEECFYMTFEALNLAETYQLPVIILIDKYVQESWGSVKNFDTSALTIERGKLLSQAELDAIVASDGTYLRHKHTPDGISPRVLPGMPGGRHIGSSYEHEEGGYSTEDETETIAQNDKRFEKLETFLKTDAKGPVLYGPADADVTIVGWGSTKRPALEALRMAEAGGLSVNYLHFIYIDPLPIEQTVAALSATKNILSVEGNKTGQFAAWIRQHTSIHFKDQLLSYGGRPFYPEDIVEKVKSMLQKKP